MQYINIKKLILSLIIIMITLGTSMAWADPVPKARLIYPGSNHTSATMLPPGYSFEVTLQDDDGLMQKPRKFRYLVKEAVVDGVVINTKYQYDLYVDELISFHDEAWSEWMDVYLGSEDPTLITMPELEIDQYYICAVQVLDDNGCASMDLGYSHSVANFRVVDDLFTPTISAMEQYLGVFQTSQWQVDIASGQELNFQAQASAQYYGGSITSLRYGWDLQDPDDPNDPGWGNPAGFEDDTLVIPEHSFHNGLHSLTIQAIDSYGYVSTMVGDLSVIPFVSPENQLPLLFVDQVVDNQTNLWPNEDGTIIYDHEDYRNAFWSFLSQDDGVQGYDENRDRYDHTESFGYENIVAYKSVLINARMHSQQLLFQQFRPENDQDKYVWLNPYQAQGGNLFLVGNRSMDSFLEVLSYMVPLVFDTDEQYFSKYNTNFTVGFGKIERPDGSTVNRGITMYPYLTAGISTLDWSVPINKNIYDRPFAASQDRSTECSGIKAMVLSGDFRNQHQINGLALSDTMHTNLDIDWRDSQAAGIDTNLSIGFHFVGDEFVDANVSSRTTDWQPQECSDGVDGLCVEPMYQGVTRFDFLRKANWDAGNSEWPQNVYTPQDLNDICGEMALTTLETPGGDIPNGTARVNDLTYGYLSYKNVANKPSGKADAYWGFDPYRFDHGEAKKSVRWVLQYFGLSMNR
ncbi:MAG: hypothetical protein GY780_00460 [bacterium]|nr:hypothetical protein [bacterium]